MAEAEASLEVEVTARAGSKASAEDTDETIQQASMLASAEVAEQNPETLKILTLCISIG